MGARRRSAGRRREDRNNEVEGAEKIAEVSIRNGNMYNLFRGFVARIFARNDARLRWGEGGFVIK